MTALDLLKDVDRNTKHMHASLENLGRLYPSHADSSEEEVSPLLTVRDFEGFAMSVREMTGVRHIAYVPFILDEATRFDWEFYTLMHQSWIETSAATFHPDWPTENVQVINPRIWLRDAVGNGIVDPGPTPYAPLWQVSPPPVADTSVINFNMASDRSVGEWISLQLNQSTSWSFLSQPVNTSSIFGTGNDNKPDDSDEPTSLAWIPVTESLSSPESPVAGAIVANVPWTTLLRNVSIMQASRCVVCALSPFQLLNVSVANAGTFEG